MEDVCGRHKDFFNSLMGLEQSHLLQIGNKRNFLKDEMVFHSGARSDDVFILLEGRVKIFELSSDGREVILWFCFAGELFGLAEVLRHIPRAVNAQACSAVELLVVRQQDFEGFLRKFPDAALNVIELLSGRLRELGDVLLNLASDDVMSRVVKLLTRLAARYGKIRADCVYLDIPLTHQEMADMIGTSRQTVTTVLGALRKKGALRTERHTVVIQNATWIEAITHNTQNGGRLQSTLTPITTKAKTTQRFGQIDSITQQL